MPVLGSEEAGIWASQLKALADRGLKHVTFTGGEPTLAFNALEVLARSASEADLETALVTAATWANSDRQIHRTVDRLAPHISMWDIGHDSFHAGRLELGRLAVALDALRQCGARVVIRFCKRADGTDRDYLEKVRGIAGKDIGVMVQPVYELGRADAHMCEDNGSALDVPCLSTGLFVREDGSTGPCCGGLGYAGRYSHPFAYGNVNETGLLHAWRKWRQDRLLRLQRLVGLRPLIAQLQRSDRLDPRALQGKHVCETCTHLWGDGGNEAEAARRWSEESLTTAVLDGVETQLYGNVWQENLSGDFADGVER